MTADPNATRIRLITERLQMALAPQDLQITDQSHLHAGHAAAKAHGGGHFAVQIVSEQFRNKSAVERHRMIYTALGDAMGTAIHAVSINAKTPSEAATKNLAP